MVLKPVVTWGLCILCCNLIFLLLFFSYLYFLVVEVICDYLMHAFLKVFLLQKDVHGYFQFLEWLHYLKHVKIVLNQLLACFKDFFWIFTFLTSSHSAEFVSPSEFKERDATVIVSERYWSLLAIDIAWYFSQRTWGHSLEIQISDKLCNHVFTIQKLERIS